MLTIHADSRGRALAVKGAWIDAAGTLEELAAARPRARVRQWPGILTPGLVSLYGDELLEETYHPDPREAGALGTEPLTGAAFAALAPDAARLAASARRGIQRLLRHGTVAVACGELRSRAVRDAVRRSGIGIVGRSGRPEGPVSLDPYACGRPAVFADPRQSGSAARFAVFDVPDEAALAVRGAATCVATVVEGRITYRRR
ncbi:hypothetical protein [Streptomyces ziwulingensis]|uniref:Uncharacterized protein n=1 Tax=Streptomyces ziwulingensis TaxID=1045501 RepID=A0ABP9AU56_9ACTN